MSRYGYFHPNDPLRNHCAWKIPIRGKRLIEALLSGAEVKMPPQFGTSKQAQKVEHLSVAEQGKLGFGWGTCRRCARLRLWRHSIRSEYSPNTLPTSA